MLVLIAAFSAAACAELPRFRLGYAHCLEKIRRDGMNLSGSPCPAPITLTAAGDEEESFQLIVIPDGADLEKVTVEWTPPSGAGGKLGLHVYRVDYVRTGNPSYAVEHVGWWPDPLVEPSPFDVPANRVAPLWCTVTVPPDALPGVYIGRVSISANGTAKEADIRVQVRNFTLPRPGRLATAFGLYMSKIADWYYGPKSELSIEEFSHWARFLSQYRMTPKNIGYEYIEREYTRLPDGSRELTAVDMSSLKKTIGHLSETHFSPYSYGLYRLPSGPTVEKGLQNKAAWCTPENVARPVKLYYDEWLRQGFAPEVYVYGVDEPRGEEMFAFVAETYKIVKQHVPTCKIMQTGNCDKPELIGLVDIWCPKSTIAHSPFFQNRLKDGDIVWQYVCISPVAPYPNFFLDEPGINHRILFWQTRRIGATGFLYWATIWWQGLAPTAHTGKACFPEVPLDMREQNMFTSNWVHVNGDGLLIYPGKGVTPLPSVRLEIIRDGIEDFEYFALLDELIEKVAQIKVYQTHEGETVVKQAQDLARVPDAITTDAVTFTRDPEVIFARRKAVGDMIEQLNGILINEDYKRWNFTTPTGDMDE